MNTVTPIFTPPATRRANVAIFVSGSGSNAERIIEAWMQAGRGPYAIACLFSDRPDTSRAAAIAEAHGLPFEANDIRSFYRNRGARRISLATDEGQALRAEWTDQVRAQLSPYAIDFGLLAGFEPLCNITADFPCLNIHPGDLTYEKDGQRLLIGLHTVPIERAILEGLDHLRSSVIQALPYTGRGDDMDNGPILGLSPAVPIDLGGHGLEELCACAAQRPAPRRPRGGFADALERVAKANQERLKEGGDWIVFPPVVRDFAAGRFGLATNSRQLYYRADETWLPVRTVHYGPEAAEPIPA